MTDKKSEDQHAHRSDKEHLTNTRATSAEEDELAALRSRVAALEVLVAANRSEQSDDDRSRRRSASGSSRHRSRRRTRRARDDRDDRSSRRRVDDSVRDLSSRSMDEGNKVIRAMAMAWIEQLRTAADAVAAMAEEVNDRNRADNRDSLNDMMMTLPRDIKSGWINAMDRSMDIPGNAIDRYNESYDEAEELEDKEDRDDDSSRSSRVRRADRRDDRVVTA